ncbi:MAG: hypothetical protein KIT84_22940 [Labilithrix sp.]|nr:hypothetical protein [Labilithrix sp.]MCW5813902.1 hypothetical protein [Labilithrix sp.]
MTRRQVSRVVYGLFVVVVAVFVSSNVWQVAKTIFFGGTATYPKVAEACGAAIEREIAAIERARAAAAPAGDAEDARARYAATRKSEGVDLDGICREDPSGVDAVAAVRRYDRAAESHAVRAASEIGPVRQSARSFIRVP